MAENDDNQQQPVIRKKIKKGGEGGHGGAWKVAYADFVTAMMAFFLLMWLLNATTQEQQSGIADYFSPVTASKSSSGGGGVLSGQTVSKDGALTSRNAPVGMNMEVPAAPPATGSEESGKGDKEGGKQGGDENLKKAESQIRQSMQDSTVLKKLKDHISLKRTPEGLKIQLMDRVDESMFKKGSAEPKPRTRKLLKEIAANIKQIPNELVIEGHTDGTSFGGGAAGYSNWELSAERANATRRILVQAGIQPGRIDEVAGRADQDLLVPDDPTSPRNRRIAILIKRTDQDRVAKETGGGVPSGNTVPAAGGGQSGNGTAGSTGRGGGQNRQQDGGPSLIENQEGG